MSRPLVVVTLAAALLGNTSPLQPATALAARAVTPTSSIDRNAIRAVVRRHAPAIRRCYEAALAKQPGLVGRVVVRFSVASSGNVPSAEVVESTLRAPEMEACVLRVVRQMVFPPHRGADVSIVYPFVFNSTT